MGTCSSKGSADVGLERRLSTATETKIQKALKIKKQDNDLMPHPITFEKILLKFEAIRGVVAIVKTVFSKVATDGMLSQQGFQAAMTRMDAHMTMEEVHELLEFADLENSQSLTIKEFFVALVVGSALDRLPSLSRTPAKPAETPGKQGESPNRPPVPGIQRQFSSVVGHETEIRNVLNLVISAYLIFDPKATGQIKKSEVVSLLDEHKGKGENSQNINSQQRWDEMDWDGNGNIDFAEFVYALTTWVEVDDDDDE
jgi:calcium-binding protein CML